MSIKLIIKAAVANSLRVFPIRFGLLIKGITATPVSNPESPNASLGKTIRDKPITINKFRGSNAPFPFLTVNSAVFQFVKSSGCVNTS